MMDGELWHEKCLSEIDWLSRNLGICREYSDPVISNLGAL